MIQSIKSQVILSNERAKIWAGYYFDVKRLKKDSTFLRNEIATLDTAFLINKIKIKILENEIKNDTTVKNNYVDLLNKEKKKVEKKEIWNKVFKNIAFTEFIIITVGVLLFVFKII